MGMYQFPAGAVTNNHKLGGLKEQKFNSLQVLESDAGNQFYWSEIKMSARVTV